MTRQLRALLVSLSALGLSCTALAQNAQLQGQVADTSGAVIPKALVRVVDQRTGTERRTTTNGGGQYIAPGLDPSVYKVFVQANGFSTAVSTPITLTVGQNAVLDFKMQVGQTSQTVTVNSGGLQINTTDASVSTVIDRQFVENIPLNGRSFQDLLSLAPGVSQVAMFSTGFSGDLVVNGQRTEANYFTVDGVSANVGSSALAGQFSAGVAGNLPALTALGTTQGLASVDDLQEFRAVTSTYSAEYGRSPGGQFSFATRAGTKSFHGSLYDYLRNDVFDANNWFNDYYSDPKGKERQNDFGGTFGGPIPLSHLKDNTFFFFSYEGLRLSSPQAATKYPVPENTLRQASPAALQPLLNAFPIENGGADGLNDGFGYYIETVSFPSSIDSTSIRIDHSFGEKIKVFGRFAETPSTSTTYEGAIENPTETTISTLTLGSTFTPTVHQSNEFRFNYTYSGGGESSVFTDLGGATPFQLSSLPGPNGSAFPSSNSGLSVVFLYGPYTSIATNNQPQSQYQFNMTDSHIWSMNKHLIKAGVDWRFVHTNLAVYSPREEMTFHSETQVLTNAPSYASAQIDGLPNDNQPVDKYLSTYIEDEWRISPRLSLSSGLRWDIAFSPTNANGPLPYNITQDNDLATTQLAPQGTPLWATDWKGFAPRIGLAYQLRPSPSKATVVRAGFGVFYDPGNEIGAMGYDGIGFTSVATYSSASFPLTAAQMTLPSPSAAIPYTGYIYGYDPHLRMPYTFQYNLSVEQGLGNHDSLTLGYVGAGARKLITSFNFYPGTIGNPYFDPSAELTLTQGRASSSYSSLQAKYQKDLSHGLQAIVSYTYSHSIDDASNNFQTYYLLRASSDFDVRHNFQAAVTYNTPSVHGGGLMADLANGWNIDARLQARSALPVDIIGNQTVDPASGTLLNYQPELVSGEPLYLYSNAYPGGKIINYNAFQILSGTEQGNTPRNYARGFNLVQLDPAIQRSFPVHDALHLEFRAEAYNIFNHPMFGPIYNYLAYGQGEFGYAYNTANTIGNLNSLYQSGGPRSLQFSLRFKF